MDVVARINFPFESWTENVWESLIVGAAEWIGGRLRVKEFSLLNADSLLMTLFCSLWFPGDIRRVLRSRPTSPDPSAVLRSNSKPRRDHCAVKDHSCCSDSSVPACACEGKAAQYVAICETQSISQTRFQSRGTPFALCAYVSHVFLHLSVGVNMYDRCNVNIRYFCTLLFFCTAVSH